MEHPKYEALSTAAKRLGKSAPTVKRWIDEGKLEGFRPVPTAPRYALTADVDRLLKELEQE